MTFQVDADGLLSVSAREEAGRASRRRSRVKPSYGLTDDEIARMLTESFSTAEQDMHERSLRESRVEADRMLLATRAALAADGDLLEAGERVAIDAAARVPWRARGRAATTTPSTRPSRRSPRAPRPSPPRA